MKRWLFIGGAIGFFIFSWVGASFAVESTWYSSHTATADSLQALCVGTQRGHIHGVCVNTGVASSTMTIVNSTWTLTANNIVAKIDASSKGCEYFDSIQPSGLMYDKFGTSDVTIEYDCH